MDEEAELALLDQHLIKTNRLGQRMTSILGQLDNRLYRLDKAITPLGLQPYTRKDTNLDALLKYLSEEAAPSAPLLSAPTSSSNNAKTTKGYSLGTPAVDSALLLRGPDIMALGEYFGVLDSVIDDLERMYKGLMEGRGGARDAGVKELTQLLEASFQKMVQLFLRLSKDGMGRTFDVEILLSRGPPTPPNLFPPLNALLPLSLKITNMLNPSHATPKTLQIIQPIWDDTASEFAFLRGSWICRSLSGLVTKTEEADEGGIWAETGGSDKVDTMMKVWDAILIAAEAETMLISSLFPEISETTILPQALSHPVELANKTFSPILNTLRKNVSHLTFTALKLYAFLLKLQYQWKQTMTSCLSRLNTPASSQTRDLVSTLNQPISNLRSLSLRSFPEKLADIRSARTDGSLTSAISEVTYSTITYLENLMEYEQVVEGLLAKSISERSWLMGMKEAPSNIRSAEEEGGIVKFFVADVLGTLFIHLNARTKAMKRPIGQAFMLNNSSHIRNMLVIQSNSDITGPGAESMLNRIVREARAAYISEFQSLVALLSSPPQHHNQRFGVPQLPTSEKQLLKESSIAFFDRLQELEAIISNHPLNRQDPEMRDSVGKEIEGLVRRGYDAFVTRCQNKGAEKYLRGSSSEIGKRILAIFK
ncbi:hypothetical protein L204_104679 [Cryptococcus depauperatus]|nr:hypothetical protein L204_03547 [Cryptococcus depauperatus CBS 7855]